MKIAVSACLLGENCKYNGGNNFNPALKELLAGHQVIPVCPELAGGLSVPREAAEIVAGTVRHKDGSSVDAAFRKGAQKALEQVRESSAELVILQSRSPSCGVREIYDGSFSGKLTAGKGVFARLLAEQGIKTLDVADLQDFPRH